MLRESYQLVREILLWCEHCQLVRNVIIVWILPTSRRNIIIVWMLPMNEKYYYCMNIANEKKNIIIAWMLSTDKKSIIVKMLPTGRKNTISMWMLPTGWETNSNSMWMLPTNYEWVRSETNTPVRNCTSRAIGLQFLREAFKAAHDFSRTCITGVQGKGRLLASLNCLNSYNAIMW